MTLLLACSAFFSGTETALFLLTRDQVAALRRRGGGLARLLDVLAERPAGLLVAILFGNLVVNVLFFSTGTVLSVEIAERFGGGWAAATGVATLLATIFCGEMLPKAIGISFPEHVVRTNASLLLTWYRLLGPLRRGLEVVAAKLEPKGDPSAKLTPGDLRMLIEATRSDATFGIQEKEIVEEIVGLAELRVREVMTPRIDVLFRSADSPVGETLRAMAAAGVETLPVYERNEDEVIGVAELSDLFAERDPNRPLRDLLRPVCFVPETRRADETLRDFLREALRLVCVVDEYGGISGMLTPENLLQEVVGEFDPAEGPAVERLGETVYRLDGRLGIREWRRLFVGFLPDETLRTLALDTVGGLVTSLLKRMPKVGDSVCVGDLRFTVERIAGRRIDSVLLELAGEDSAGREAK